MKKIFSIILCMSLCMLCVLPVSAAEVLPKEDVKEREEINATSDLNYVSKVLPKLNSINGIASNCVTVSTGSVSGNIQMTSISFYVRVSGDPFILYVQAPDGTMYSFVIAKSGTVTIDDLNGCSPSGTWKIWIETLGTASTATITVKMNYS